MESLFIPTQISILAEIGDKTQLLAMLLTLRFRKPWPIVWGMLIGILGNHILAAEVAARQKSSATEGAPCRSDRCEPAD